VRQEGVRIDVITASRVLLWLSTHVLNTPSPGVPVLDVGFTALTLVLALAATLLVRALERR
jgi:hypothetical protein